MKRGVCLGYKIEATTDKERIIGQGCRAEILRYLLSPVSTGKVLDICMHVSRTERYILDQLKVLEEADLIDRDKRWKISTYSINRDKRRLVLSQLRSLEAVKEEVI